MKRWIDLSEYGMRLYIAVLPTTKALVIDKVPEELTEAVTALGFRKRPNSNAWTITGNLDLNTTQYLRLLPKAKVRPMDPKEFVVKFDDQSQKKDSEEPPVVVERQVLGLNRLGQEVIVEDGVRYIVDNRGRQLREDSFSFAIPGMMLRAVDDSAIAMCAEGYVETAIRYKGKDCGDLSVFVRNIGLTEKDITRFKGEVADAALRFVNKKGTVALQDRYLKSVEIANALQDQFGDVNFDRLILARRLMGLDKDLIGNSVYIDGGNNEFFFSLFPQAVRKSETLGAADFSTGVSDESSLEKYLKARKLGAFSLSIVNVDDGANPSDLISRIKENGAIEAAALYAPDGQKPILFVTSVAGDASNDDIEIEKFDDAASLWSWASVTANNRAHSIEAFKMGLSTDADLTPSAIQGQNSHQIPYRSASKLGTPRTMVPKELEGPTREALDRVISMYGDIDDRVAVECGLPKDGLEQILSPEQIDSVALAIHAENRGRAFLFADGTGVGKTRPQVALARRAILQGKKVLFLTEKPINMSDVMRDIKAIKSLDVLRPVIMNKDAVLIDETTREEFDTADRNALEHAIADRVWPDDCPLIFSTYSQFNQSPEESDRSAWLRDAVDEDVVVIADEIHTAASGDSNTSINVAKAISKAGSVFMASATFAASAKMMAFFERLFPNGLSAEEIAAMIRKGGEQFQEVVSAMLVADGVMLRRELDLSHLNITQLVDNERVPRNREFMDKLAAVLGEMAILSGELDDVVKKENERKENALKGLQFKRVGFGSPLYLMQRIFSASLIAEFAAEQAIEAIKNGEKPIIQVENTLQGVLEDALENGGDAPDFKAAVKRILSQITKLSYSRPDGEDQQMDVADDEVSVHNHVSRIHALINELPDLEASFIDHMKKRLQDAGISCGELTGRSLQVVDGKVVTRKDRNNLATKNDFNSGKLDALIMNSSASTGVSMNAGEQMEDKRPRVFIVAQGLMNITKQQQAFGRITRYDDAVPSRIVLLSTGLPIEARLAAMQNQKLRRLSATVTSNRDSVYLTKNIPDLINPVGDAVVTKYAEMRPDLVKRLCLTSKFDSDNTETDNEDKTESQRDNDRSANEFLSRLSVLPTEHQEKVIQEISAEYEMHIAELEARGENPLRPRELEGVVHIRSKEVFEGSEDSGNLTAFDGPMHILDVSIERVAEPIKSEHLMEAVEKGSSHFGRAKKALSQLIHNRDMYLEPFLPKKHRTVQAALDAMDPRITRMSRHIDDLNQALTNLAPGKEIAIQWDEGDVENAIITSIVSPGFGYEHLPHLYRVDVAIPGRTAIKGFRLDTLINELKVAERLEDGTLSFKVSPGLEGNDYDKVLDRFENAVAHKTTPARILTTNIFRAVRMAAQMKLGSLVSFVDSDGQRHRGVLIKRSFENKMEKISARVESKDAAIDLLLKGLTTLNSSPTNSKAGLRIIPGGNDTWTAILVAPRKKAGEYNWPSDAYKHLFLNAGSLESGRRCVSIKSGEELKELMDILYESGFGTFYISGKFRDDVLRNEGSPKARAA